MPVKIDISAFDEPVSKQKGDIDISAFDEDVKKKSTPSGYSVTPLPSQDKLKLGQEVATVGYKSPLGKAIQEDKVEGSNIAGLYNTLVGSLSSLAGGSAYMADILAPAAPLPLNLRVANAQADRKKVADFIEQARSSKSSREFEQQQGQFDITPKEGGGVLSGLDWEDVKGLAFQAPKTILDMAAGGVTGGYSFFAQSVNDNAKDLEDNEQLSKLSDTQKVGYLFTQATAQAALEYFSIDKILKNTGLAKSIEKKIASEVVSEFAKKGVKATAKDIENEMFKKAAKLSTKIKNVGIKGLESSFVEGTTEGVQQAASDAIKLTTNKIAKNEVFNEEDINKNFWKNIVNNAVMGGVMGGVTGGGLQGLNSTDKAIRQEIANATGEKKFYVDDQEVTEKEFNQATGNKKVTTDLQHIQDQINQQVEEGNLTPEEAQAANITAQQYAEIAGKIPSTVSPDDKYKIIGGISQRNKLQQDLQTARDEMMQVDPIFRKEKQDQVDLIQAKIEETNNYLEGIASGKEPKYKERRGMYFKVDAEGEIPVSKETYDLANAIKKNDENKITDFVNKIASGEKIETPEDLQFYDNNKKEIESALQQKAKEEKPIKPIVRTTGTVVPMEEIVGKPKVQITEEVKPTEVKEEIKVEPVAEVKPEVKSKLEAFKTKFAPKEKELTPEEQRRRDVGLRAAGTRKDIQEANKIQPTDERSAVLSWLSGGNKLNWEAINEAAGKRQGAELNVEKDFNSEEVQSRDYAGKTKDEGMSINDAAHEIWENLKQQTKNENFSDEDVRNFLIDAVREHTSKKDAAKKLVQLFSEKPMNIEEQQAAYYERQGEEGQPTENIQIEGGFKPVEGVDEFAVKEQTTEELNAMQDIVADYVKDGVTALPDIKKAIAKELGYNTKALRQIVEDAFNNYTASKEAAPKEILGGILGRISNKMSEMFGRESQKPYIAKDSKSIKAKYQDISETGGRPAFQVKLPNGESVTAKPIDASVVNGFYSPLELQINQMKADKMPAKQWLEKLRGEESKWSGLADWLSQQKESVSKDQIKNYLNTNKVEIFEIVKGAPNKLDEEQIQRLNYLIKLDKENPGGAIEDIEEGKFKDNSYDELLYLLNVRDNSNFEELNNLQLEAEQKARLAQAVGLKDKADKLWDDAHRYTKRIEILELSPAGEGGVLNPTKFSQYQLGGEKSDYREILITQPQKLISKPKDEIYYDAKKKDEKLRNEKREIDKEYRDAEEELDKLRFQRDEIRYKTEKTLGDVDKQEALVNKIQETKNKSDEIYEKMYKIQNKIWDNNSILEDYEAKLEDHKFLYTTHFDEANILVHARTNIRKDVDGNTIFFAEEIQSDWGQKGREQGFKFDALTDTEKNRYNELKDITNEKAGIYRNLYDAYDLYINRDTDVESEEFINFMKSNDEERKKILTEKFEERKINRDEYVKKMKDDDENSAELKELLTKEFERTAQKDYENYTEAMFSVDKTVPFDIDTYKKEIKEKNDLSSKRDMGTMGKNPAPFVTKTNDWAKLGLKSLLKEAVKAGADRLAWTNGEQQNERWSLAKHIDDLQVFRRGDDFYVVGYKYGNDIFSKEIKKDELGDNIGKDLADKVINDFSDDENMQDKTYSDADLEIGGNGMKSFYGVPFENKLGIIGEVAKSLFKQTPKKLELQGVSNIKEVKERLQTRKDELILLRQDLDILKNKPEVLNNLNELNNKLREDYYKNEEEYSKLSRDRREIVDKRDKIDNYIKGYELDERTKQIQKEIDKLLNYEGEIKNNREYSQWNKELDDLADEKKEIINNYQKENLLLNVDYQKLTDEMRATSDKSRQLERESNDIKRRIQEIKDSVKNEKNLLKKIKDIEDGIAKGAPMQWYVDITPELKQQVQQGLPLFMANPSGADVLGFSYNNKMYLNGEKLNPNTIIHEAGHIWTEWIKNNDTKVYEKGLELVENSPYLTKAKSSKFYQEQAEKLTTQEEKDIYFKHEALAMAIGDKGAQFVLESKKANFKDWLKTLWSKIKNLTGFKDLTEEEFQNLTFEEFTKKAVKEILGTENQLDKFEAIKSFRSKKNFVKANLKYESNKKAIDELDFTEEDLYEIVKSNFDLSTFKNIKDAVQKRSAKKILQRQQGGNGEAGGGRKRVEPRIQGEGIAGEGEGETTQPQGTTQIPEEIENVGLDNQDVSYVGITEADINDLRKSLGLPKYKGLPTETHSMLRDVAQEMIKKGVDVQSLYDKIRRGDALSNYENAFMAEYRAALDLELKNNPSQELLAKIREFANTFQVGASLAGKGLESLKIMKKLNEANTLSNFLLTRQEDKGYTLTPKMIAEEVAKFEKVQKAKTDLEESAKKDVEEQIKAEVKAEEGKQAKKSHEEFVKERKEALAAARDALKKLRSGEQGLMVSVPGLSEIIAVAPHMNKYAKSLFAEGVSKLDDIVTEVHAEFSDLIDGLTKRDVLDVITGKHNVKTRTANEINAGLRLLRREAELLIKLEQVRKGEEEAKSESQMAEKSKRIQDLERKIKEVRELNKAKEYAEEGVYENSPSIDKKVLSDFEYNQKRQKFLDKKIKKLEEDLKNKNYDKEEKETKKYYISKKTQAKMDKVIELEKALALERYNDQYKKLSKWEKAWDKAESIFNIKRIVQTSIDASIWFRQLAKLTLNPRKWDIAKKFISAGVQSVFSQKNYDRLMYGIHQAPDFKESIDDGIRYNELDAVDSKSQNEMYPKSFVFKIPIVRDLIISSQRIADASLNVARYELYNKYKKNLLSQGITRESDPKVYEEMAKLVMNSTGSGNMLKILETPAGKKVAGSAFYGARLMAANFNTLNPAYYVKMPKEVRAMAMKDLAAYTSTILATTLALAAAGGAVSMDPDDPEFLQVRFGDKVYDFTAGQAAYIRTFLRLVEAGYARAAKSKFEANEAGAFAAKSTLTFFRNKLAPNKAYLANAITGKNSIGQDFDPMELFHIYPMYADDAYKAAKEDGFISLFTVLMPNILGIGYASYYSDKSMKPVDEIIGRAQDSDEMNPESIKKGITKDEFKEFAKLRDKLISDKITELYQEGIFDEELGEQIPIKKAKPEQITKAIMSLKRQATGEAKAEFNADEEE